MKIVYALILTSVAFTVCLLVKGYGIRFNNSASLPHTLYLAIPTQSIQKDQIVSFHLQASPVTFAKMVVGLPGDKITVQNQKAYINDVEKGQIIEPHNPIKEGVIPTGYYFVIGTHPESFDSRYEEFGLVPLDAIKERLCPIF